MAAKKGEPAGMHCLGLLLEENGRSVEAETWLRQGADRGDIFAIQSLVNLLKNTGRVEEATAWKKQAGL